MAITQMILRSFCQNREKETDPMKYNAMQTNALH